MKLIKVLPNGDLVVEAEDVLESLYDVGEYIEFEYNDFKIIAKKEKQYILR